MNENLEEIGRQRQAELIRAADAAYAAKIKRDADANLAAFHANVAKLEPRLQAQAKAFLAEREALYADLKRILEPGIKDWLKAELKGEVTAELRAEITAELKAQVTAELRAEITAELKAGARAKVKRARGRGRAHPASTRRRNGRS